MKNANVRVVFMCDPELLQKLDYFVLYMKKEYRQGYSRGEAMEKAIGVLLKDINVPFLDKARDPLQRFIAEFCIVGKESVNKSAFLKYFNLYMEHIKLKSYKKLKLKIAMSEKGFGEKQRGVKHHRDWAFDGITIDMDSIVEFLTKDTTEIYINHCREEMSPRTREDVGQGQEIDTAQLINDTFAKMEEECEQSRPMKGVAGYKENNEQSENEELDYEV